MQEPATRTARCVRAADACVWQGTFNSFNCEIVKFVVRLGGRFPIENVGFVPDLPAPLFHLRCAVPLSTVFCPLETEFAPLCIVFGWIAKAQARADHLIRRRMMRIILWVNRQTFRHETDFNKRIQVSFTISIENPVYD